MEGTQYMGILIQLHYSTTFAGTLNLDIQFSFVVICTFANSPSVIADPQNKFIQSSLELSYLNL